MQFPGGFSGTAVRNTAAPQIAGAARRGSCFVPGMAADEDHGIHEHVVEIANDSPAPRGAPRRSFATIAVAVCLGLAAAVTAFALVRDESERASDEQQDAAQREQLLDGWNTLGAVAAAQHTSDELRAPPTPSADELRAPPAPPGSNSGPAPQAAAPAPVQNVIVVGGSAPAAAPQVNQSLPAPASGNVSTTSGNVPTAATITLSTSARATPPPAPGGATPVGVPAPPSGPNQTPLTPAPGSPDTVLSPITYPASQSCGLTTCNVDSVCCNVSCGVCTAPGETCPQTQCG